MNLRFHAALVLIAALFFISADLVATPTCDFTASNQAICVGYTTTFTGTFSGTITSYSWNFGIGASPATASSPGPHTVTYSTSGSKTITLSVTGPDGTTTTTKTNYVDVGVQRVKIMSYNLLNYSDFSNNDTTTRHPYFRTIISAADPDILVVQEVISQNAINAFLQKVMNANGNSYSAGTFINGFDSDNGIYYKTSKFHFISNTPIETDLRDINEFKLSNILTGDTLRIYSVHLKASTGSSNEAQRALEVDSLRKFTNALPLHSNFIVCGDFNIYGSGESAYTKLKQTNASDDGRFIDPLNMSGTWNNSNYAIRHTQSTRDTALGTGGASGGLNDRFDMILYSSAVSQSGGIAYVPNSLTAFGNDGNHYSISIYIQPNTAVTPAVASALYYASDHLPVYANFDFTLNNCQSLDIGPTTLVSPTAPACPSVNRQVQVRVKNFGVNAVDFSVNNATVNVQLTNPSAAVSNYSQSITSGILSAGDSMTVTLDSLVNMNTTGNYQFDVSVTFAPDINLSNNSISSSVGTSLQIISAITPPGPVAFCNGSSVVLTAGNGSGYQWSNGESTQSVSVDTAGNYSATFTDQNGCLNSTDTVAVSVNNFEFEYTVVSENMGNAATTTSITTYEANNGFQNTALTMSGTGEVRNTNASAGYPGASGSTNVFLTNTVGKNFIISGINTSTSSNLILSFGVFKSTTASNGSELSVSYSTDGVNYFPLTLPVLPVGSAGWSYVTINDPLPSVPNLRIQFQQTSTVPQFRIDDLLLSGKNTDALISAQGPTSFCQGSVMLTSTVASQYAWNNGETTQNITAATSGNYAVTLTGSNGCTLTSNSIAVNAGACSTLVSLRIFIEGFYTGGGTMKAVQFLNQPGICDSITLQLASVSGNHSVLYENKSLLHTDGLVEFTFPPAALNNSYYFVIRHRNSLEAWSSAPILINNSSFSYQFSDSPGKIFGSNEKSMNDGNYAIYSGDVNQDGIINMNDVISVATQSSLFLTGYLPADITGDNMIESADYSIVENNLLKAAVRP